MKKIWPHIKGAYKSVTMWINGAFAAVISNWDAIMQNYPQLGQYMNADHFKYIAGAIVVANIALRFRTNKSLADK
jgi:hypothetical protein